MRNAILFLALFTSNLIFAQSKYDYNWFSATAPSTNPDYGMSRIDFNTDPPTLSKVWGAPLAIINANVSWSNKDGFFLYFSNGCKVVDSTLQIMQNGDSINPGTVNFFYCDYGYPLDQDILVLADVTNENSQYMFHLGMEEVSGLQGLPVMKLYYTAIKGDENNGLGAVVEKNQILVEDTLGTGFLTAVKHANGQYWWVVMPENSTNGYYIILLDEDGPHVHRKQHIGTVQDPRDWAGQAVFSPDGRFYARADGYSGLEVMEFDRCHGAFFNSRHVELPLDEGALLGAAISPNSRYLYVSSQVVLLQYDLLAPDLAASMDTVGVYDGFESWLPTSFHIMQLGPNGKIYMFTSNGTNVLHVIQQPDEPGNECLFEQHAVILPTYCGISPPNFPNYRLGPAPENYCDSVTATVEPPHFGSGLELFPNPASEYILVKFTNPADGELRIVDMQGHLIYRADVPENSTDIFLDTSKWPNGIYLCQYWANGKVVAVRKSILAH